MQVDTVAGIDNEYILPAPPFTAGVAFRSRHGWKINAAGTHVYRTLWVSTPGPQTYLLHTYLYMPYTSLIHFRI